MYCLLLRKAFVKMNIEATRLELMQLLLQTEKASLLAKLKKVFEEEGDWWDELSAEEKEEINQGIKEAEEGKTTEHSEVMKSVFN